MENFFIDLFRFSLIFNIRFGDRNKAGCREFVGLIIVVYGDIIFFRVFFFVFELLNVVILCRILVVRVSVFLVYFLIYFSICVLV